MEYPTLKDLMRMKVLSEEIADYEDKECDKNRSPTFFVLRRLEVNLSS